MRDNHTSPLGVRWQAQRDTALRQTVASSPKAVSRCACHRTPKRLDFLVAALLFSLIAVTQAKTPPQKAPSVPSSSSALIDLKIFPPDINLSSKQDKQSLVVQAIYSDGATRDVTSEATLTLKDKSLARLDKATILPLGDGKTELGIAFKGRSLTVPISVDHSQLERPISFRLDVMPVFMKAGCNVGGCHGSSRGKDGFRLSLFGFDPDGDYYRLTREN